MATSAVACGDRAEERYKDDFERARREAKCACAYLALLCGAPSIDLQQLREAAAEARDAASWLAGFALLMSR